MRNKKIFYLLSFTWGLPLTLIGCIIAAVLMACGKKPIKYGWFWYFEVGYYWGGLELGPIFLVQHKASEFTKTHEAGHGIQNTRYGPMMLFIVTIPSAIRYWYREFRSFINRPCKTGYQDIWFEAEANRLGAEVMSLCSGESDEASE